MSRLFAFGNNEKRAFTRWKAGLTDRGIPYEYTDSFEDGSDRWDEYLVEGEEEEIEFAFALSRSVR